MAWERSPRWYESAFGELYPVLYAHRDDASAEREIADLLETLAIDARGLRVCDLCCGNGRHARALARRGAQVAGIDLSPQLLAIAGERAELRGCLARGDMRRVPLRTGFDLVINLFTSFGYFPTDAANHAVLGEAARLLQPGGRLVLDHINARRVRRTLVPQDGWTGPGYRVIQRRWIEGPRVHKEIRVEWASGRRARICEDVRLYDPEELQGLLADSGFGAARIYGSFGGASFGPDAERMIAVARKNAG